MSDEAIWPRSEDEKRKLLVRLRRLRPAMWLLRMPGVAPFVARRANARGYDISPELVRWFARTGYAHALRTLSQGVYPKTADDWLSSLERASPPPGGLRPLVERLVRESRGPLDPA